MQPATSIPNASVSPPPRRSSRLPTWLRVPFTGARTRAEVRRLLRDLNLNTVCESAVCPNLCTCWKRETATFMLLGNACTRDCLFCAVTHAAPAVPDPAEPANVARAARALGLSYVVLTSVTRDDLSDGGARHFAATVEAVRKVIPAAGIEVLTPDFKCSAAAIATVLSARPTVFNHNLETCERLTESIRSGASYVGSLAVLSTAARHGRNTAGRVKSGFMLGMGETDDEIKVMLRDLAGAGVQILTIGQYLPPSPRHWPVTRYVTPDEFAEWGRTAREAYGFDYVMSAPLVRSSYMAAEASIRQGN